MNEMIVVEDVVSEDCVRKLHVMSNAPISMQLPAGATVKQTQEAGVYHLRAEWPYRGVLDIKSDYWPRPKRLVVWSLIGEEHEVEAILEAIGEFDRLFGHAPGFIFLRRLPSDVEHGKDLFGMVFLETEWMLEKCVAVGGW